MNADGRGEAFIKEHFFSYPRSPRLSASLLITAFYVMVEYVPREETPDIQFVQRTLNRGRKSNDT